ncbi:MAG: glycogen/starch/alpha-glucan phosphorylase [bacterium]|nr:glycogen/starch/alpha-glucan phosphorylase [bacterium]
MSIAKNKAAPVAPVKLPSQHPSVDNTAKGLAQDFLWNMRFSMAKSNDRATERDCYSALAYAVRDRIVDRWMATQDAYRAAKVRRVYYLSLEFLIGRLLGNNVINLGLEKECREAMDSLGLDWNRLRDYEMDAGLGNGGLGRLAACFLDSLATLNLPAMGYGLRYDYGIFRQRVVNGEQREEPDNWLKYGYPWEIQRPEYTCLVGFGGHVEHYKGRTGRDEWVWVPAQQVQAVPYDLPVVGYKGTTIGTLRLWSAHATNEFSLEEFNRGSYVEAVEAKVLAENLTKVLYPNDSTTQGKELRLRQQYLFVAASVHDIIRRFRDEGHDWKHLAKYVFIQLNDTHPTLVIPELMRILVDIEGIAWDEAWKLVRACTGYTNHTVLPEALEKWPVPLMERVLPRHMQIIYEINARFLQQVANLYPGDLARLGRMSLIDEAGDKYVRMANLCLVGTSAINGVAALHSEILKKTIFRDFFELMPDHFSNKTNGITQRRWLLKANPRLANLITDSIGDKWITNLSELSKLKAFANDASFLEEFADIKRANKQILSNTIFNTLGFQANPDAIFDVQVKRLHEYKRQLLLVLYIIVLFNRLIEKPDMDIHPRVFVFGAKAAPGYWVAKLIIRLIHGVAEVVNNHPLVKGRITVAFLPDYRVSLAEKIIPAANVSEQISLAGTEASGTGNMKLMLNGALTLGTLDGANVEIAEEVGKDNIFIFGLKTEEVDKLRPTYNSRAIYESDPEIKRALDMIRRNVFSLMTPGVFEPLLKNLIDFNDYYMLLKDLPAYIKAQDRVEALYRNPKAWNKASLMNTACAGKFSSDRTIAEYAKDIWHLDPFIAK